MAYQAPRFGYFHAAAESGVVLTSNNATTTSLTRLADYRLSALTKFGSASDHWIKVNRGAGSQTAIDRLFIPEGHNLGAATLEVLESTDDAAYSSIGSVAAPGDGAVDLALTSSTDRYLRMDITGTGAYELGELFYTARNAAPVRGPAAPWDATRTRPQQRVRFPSFDAVAVLGDERQSWELTHQALSGTDLTAWDGLFSGTRGGADPFVFWPPDDGADPILVQHSQWRRQMDAVNPAGMGLMYEIRAQFLEVTR